MNPKIEKLGGMRSCEWSIASIVLSLSSMTVSYSTVEYLYRRGAWNADSIFSDHLQTYYGWAILISFVLAITAMFRDRKFWVGMIALLLSLFGILIAAAG